MRQLSVLLLVAACASERVVASGDDGDLSHGYDASIYDRAVSVTTTEYLTDRRIERPIVRLGVYLRGMLGEEPRNESEIRRLSKLICPAAWSEAIDEAKIEDLYPLDQASRETRIWCLGVQVAPGTIRHGLLRQRLTVRFPKVASTLQSKELEVMNAEGY